MQPFHGLDLSKTTRIVAAVSGGGDSLALLTLLREHLHGARSPEILAVTVDHGLRPESAAEARRVGAICTGLGAEHRIVRWDAAVPEAGVQAKARAARYGLLAQAARDAGADMVLTGHTLDDQLETVAMRAARNAGPGLAGIAPATFAFDRTCTTAGTWFARPLLGMRRAALREHLRALDIAWIDDPSNDDPRFERVRARRFLAAMNAAEHEALARRQVDAAAARGALDVTVARLIGDHASEVSAGLVRLDAGLLDAGDEDAALRAIGIVLAFVGGAPTVPEVDKLRSWTARMRDNGHAALARCVAEQRAGAIWLRRENRNVAASADGLVFDNRYGLCREDGGHAEWLMEAPVEGGDLAIAPDVPGALARQAAQSQPVLEKGGESRHLWRPQEGAPWYRLLNPWPQLVPLFDLASARAIARLAGAAEIPAPPLAKELRPGNEVL